MRAPRWIVRTLLRRTFLGRLVRSSLAVGTMAAPVRRARAQSEGRGRVVGFDHVAAPMRDTEAMVAFYRSVGFKVNEGRGICSVHFGDHKINFHRPHVWEDPATTLRAPAAQPPCGDFCFVWEGGEASLLRTLREAGADLIAGPVERSGGKDGGTARGTSRYVRDPDGNLLEFIVYP